MPHITRVFSAMPVLGLRSNGHQAAPSGDGGVHHCISHAERFRVRDMVLEALEALMGLAVGVSQADLLSQQEMTGRQSLCLAEATVFNYSWWLGTGVGRGSKRETVGDFSLSGPGS